jgi:HK97 family phage prohead protease
MKNKRYSPQTIQVKEVNRENFQIRFVLSTPSVDRHGEIIDQKGWILTNYLKNPVVLWAHDQSIPAIGKMVELGVVNGNLEGVVQFAYKENPDAAKIFDLVAGEYLNAGSVGFMNIKWMYDEKSDIITLLENELFEFSIVNVPANAEALAKAKSKGLDIEVVNRLSHTHRNSDRFKNLGEQVFPEEKPKEEVEPEATPEEPEAPKEVPIETAEPDKPEEKEPTEDEVKSALEVLCKSKSETIKGAVKELTSRLNAPEADTKGSKVDASPENQGRKKRYSNRDINRVIRSLLKKSPMA